MSGKMFKHSDSEYSSLDTLDLSCGVGSKNVFKNEMSNEITLEPTKDMFQQVT
jgi:hypothetical protein